MGSTEDSTTMALVVRDGLFEAKTVQLKEMRADEVLVRMVATGICHADVAMVKSRPEPGSPAILGHEGSGVVEKVGAAVSDLAIGDHVLLSFPACNQCLQCSQGRPAYCKRAFQLSFGGARLDGSHTFSLDGEDVFSPFFGQSSFAHRSIVSAACAVKVHRSLPLHLLCGLGCGLQTGAGTVLNILKPNVGDSVVVYGTGSVGLAAIIAAAKLTAATKVIAVDIVDAKLELARELGATHVINSKGKDVVALVKAITDGEGSNAALDATGSVPVIQAMIAAAANNSIVASVGAKPGAGHVQIEPIDWIGRNISYVGSCQGSSVPRIFLPALVELWQGGRFPIDRLVTTYPYLDINRAVEDIHSGKTIKPVILWD